MMSERIAEGCVSEECWRGLAVFCGVNYGAKNYTPSAGEPLFMTNEPIAEGCVSEEWRRGLVVFRKAKNLTLKAGEPSFYDERTI